MLGERKRTKSPWIYFFDIWGEFLSFVGKKEKKWNEMCECQIYLFLHENFRKLWFLDFEPIFKITKVFVNFKRETFSLKFPD